MIAPSIIGYAGFDRHVGGDEGQRAVRTENKDAAGRLRNSPHRQQFIISTMSR